MPLQTDIEELLKTTASELGLTPGTSEALEAAAAYFGLQDAGLDAADAAAAISIVHTGGAGDARLDAVAVIVNGLVVPPDSDLETVRTLIEDGKDVRVTMVFVQATGIDPKHHNAPSTTEKLTGFTSAIQRFLLAKDDAKGVNNEVRSLIVLKNKLLKLLKDGELEKCIVVKPYLVWPYNIQLDVSHKGDLDAFEQMIDAILGNLIREKADFEFVNESGFIRVEQDLRRKGTFQIAEALISKGPLSPSGRAEIYVGFIPGTDYANMISYVDPITRSRKILHKLFYDNVRAYLGDDGGVNPEIRATLLDPLQRDQFHLRNNGVALVARSSERRDDQKILFSDVQIVNGCQTSYSVFRTMNAHSMQDWSKVQVPVRIIVSNDDDAIDAMILGLNKQAAVDSIQIHSRRDYIIRLARFIVARNRAHPTSKIWFERRIGECMHIASPDKVITLQDMMAAYAAAFLGSPHSDLTPGELIEAVRKKRLFYDTHDPEYYFLAAVMTTRLRQSVKHSVPMPKENWNAVSVRAQLIFALRRLVDKSATAALPSSRSGTSTKTYLASIGAIILDPAKIQALCQTAKTVIANAAASATDHKGNPLRGTLAQKAGNAGFTKRVEQLTT